MGPVGVDLGRAGQGVTEMKLQNALIWSGVALAVQCAAAGEEAEPYPRVSRDAFEALSLIHI